MFSTPWCENLIKIYSVWHNFLQKGLAWTATWDRLFRKQLDFERSKSRKTSTIVRKWSEMGPEKWSGGLERSGKVKIVLRIHWEASRRPESLLKIKKRAKNMKIRKINDFTYFSYFPVWALLSLFSLFGVTRCSYLESIAWCHDPLLNFIWTHGMVMLTAWQGFRSWCHRRIKLRKDRIR